MEEKKRRFTLGNKWITFGVLFLNIFSTLMIASAEMGVDAGNMDYLISTAVKQVIFTVAGVIAYLFFMNFRTQRFNVAMYLIFYFVILVMLLACRMFEQVNGAYAWIRFGDVATLQPSEFAKVFIILFAYRLFGKDRKGANQRVFWIYAGAVMIYTFIILVYQHDLGSAVVFFVISYCLALMPTYPELRRYQDVMIALIFLALIGVGFILSPQVTEMMKAHKDNYMIARFLASADPFLYQYDQGYHIIMSLISFASGGLFGSGYGTSIHKYMNFPNPSNDFILPVIVEELGVAGFAAIIIMYCMILIPVCVACVKTKRIASRIVYLGVFLYFTVHFILNVGGVSALIPLTGVPLLMLSSGGSSLMAAMSACGIAQNEIIYNKNKSKEKAED